MLQVIVISLLVSQIAFTALDVGVLYRNQSKASRVRVREFSGPLFFLIAVWFVYFGLQVLGTMLLPQFDSLRVFLASSFPEAARAQPVWDLRTSLLFIWSFEVIAFWDFATHRWILHKKRFWIFHEYHHLPRLVINGMPGISVRPFVFFTTLLTYVTSLGFIIAPLYLLSGGEVLAFINWGVPLMAFWLTLVLSMGHSLFLRRFPAVHFILRAFGIATPQEHVLHHSVKLRCNYGNFSTIWDRVFGSYVDPATIDIHNEPLGLPYDQDYLGTLTGSRFKIPRALRERYRLKSTVCLDD